MNHTENGEVNDLILSSTVSDGKCVNGELFLNVTIALNPSREYKKIQNISLQIFLISHKIYLPAITYNTNPVKNHHHQLVRVLNIFLHIPFIYNKIYFFTVVGIQLVSWSFMVFEQIYIIMRYPRVQLLKLIFLILVVMKITYISVAFLQCCASCKNGYDQGDPSACVVEPLPRKLGH